MTDEQGEQAPAAQAQGGTAEAADNVRTSVLAQPGTGGTSPVRWLLVVVPLVIAAIGAAYLLVLWTASTQQAKRQAAPPPALQRERASEPQPADYGLPSIDAPPARPAAPFDARAVLRLLAKASPEDGARAFRMCSPCHAGEKGAPARLGPNLWGIVGQRLAGQLGFRYSAALQAKGGTWGYAELAAYIHNPRATVPGTSMAFAGIQDELRMANLLAYMRTLSDDPMPLPK